MMPGKMEHYMKDFFLDLFGLVVVLVVLFGLGLAFNVIDLSFLGWRTNAETHITRQTNAYLTNHQQALRTFKAQWDDLERQAAANTDATTLDALRSQQRGIARQMHEEADLIPNDIQPDIQSFLTNH
jgi:Tfp pilus assembly protein PilN